MVFLDALETALDIGERDPKAELEGNPVAIQIEENEGACLGGVLLGFFSYFFLSRGVVTLVLGCWPSLDP